MGLHHAMSELGLTPEFCASEKKGMQVRAATGGPFTDAERARLLEYCASDVRIHRVYEHSPAIERERDMAQLGVAVIVDLDFVEGGFVRIKRESERVRMERNEA